MATDRTLHFAFASRLEGTVCKCNESKIASPRDPATSMYPFGPQKLLLVVCNRHAKGEEAGPALLLLEMQEHGIFDNALKPMGIVVLHPRGALLVWR